MSIELIIAIVGSMVGVLGWLFGKGQSQLKDKAREETQVHKAAVKRAERVIEQKNKEVQAHVERQKIDADIAMGDIPNAPDGMRDPYQRD